MALISVHQRSLVFRNCNSGFSVFLAESPTILMLWTFGQVLCGLGAFLCAHACAAVKALKRDTRLGPIDVVTSPGQIWIEILSDFPETFRNVAIGTGGIWTILMAHLVLGVPYSALINLDAAPPKKKKMLSPAAVASALKTSGGQDLTLEEAMQQFGDQAAGGLADGAGTGSDTQTEPKPDEQLITRELNCVIIGYSSNGETGEITSLIVAAKRRSWRVLGRVRSGLTTDLQGRLRGANIASLRRATPIVKTDLKATWVEPRLRCRVQVEFLEAENAVKNLVLLRVL